MHAASARTLIAWSGDKPTNHEATAPPVSKVKETWKSDKTVRYLIQNKSIITVQSYMYAATTESPDLLWKFKVPFFFFLNYLNSNKPHKPLCWQLIYNTFSLHAIIDRGYISINFSSVNGVTLDWQFFSKDQAFSQTLKSRRPNCALGPAQISNLSGNIQCMKNKTIFFRKWLSTGRLDIHLAKAWRRLIFTNVISSKVCSTKKKKARIVLL